MRSCCQLATIARYVDGAAGRPAGRLPARLVDQASEPIVSARKCCFLLRARRFSLFSAALKAGAEIWKSKRTPQLRASSGPLAPARPPARLVRVTSERPGRLLPNNSSRFLHERFASPHKQFPQAASRLRERKHACDSLHMKLSILACKMFERFVPRRPALHRPGQGGWPGKLSVGRPTAPAHAHAPPRPAIISDCAMAPR